MWHTLKLGWICVNCLEAESCVRAVWAPYVCKFRRVVRGGEAGVGCRTKITYLEHESNDENHGHTWHNVGMVLDNKLVAKYRWIFVTLWPPDTHFEELGFLWCGLSYFELTGSDIDAFPSIPHPPDMLKTGKAGHGARNDLTTFLYLPQFNNHIWIPNPSWEIIWTETFF